MPANVPDDAKRAFLEALWAWRDFMARSPDGTAKELGEWGRLCLEIDPLMFDLADALDVGDAADALALR